MGHSINHAFAVMIIGLITVFLILWLVVIIGNLLIRVTNKYWLETEEVKNKTKTNTHASPSRNIAAIVTAVDIVSSGKGKITHIKNN